VEAVSAGAERLTDGVMLSTPSVFVAVDVAPAALLDE
jgi:hypothetical protein